MDTIEQKDRAMTPAQTPPADTKAAPLPVRYRKEFSLTSGAKYLGIGKGTLRAAIERNEVKATKNAKGHYIIEGAEIFQYEQNLEADELKAVLTTVSTRANTRAGTGVDTPPSTGVKGGVGTRADTTASTGDSTPSDRRVGTVSADMHHTVVEMMEARLRDKDGTIRRLETDVESWKGEADNWRKHADNNLRLLEDHREKLAEQEPDIDLAAVGKGGHAWRNMSLVLAAVILIGAALYFRAELTEQLVKLTVSIATDAVSIDKSPEG